MCGRVYRYVITESEKITMEWGVPVVQVVNGEGEGHVTVPDERGVQQCLTLRLVQLPPGPGGQGEVLIFPK